MKRGFTLIELLAVIIILAIVALISTPIILNVVDEARESANKSSVAMYADAVKLAVIDSYFENQSYPVVDENWLNNNVEYGGARITCEAVYYTETRGVTLNECTVGNSAFNYVDDMEVSAEDTIYCYSNGKIYTDCANPEYVTQYTAVLSEVGLIQAGYVDASGANAPELFDNMVAVKYDYNESKWMVADTTQEWYDYDEKEWANAVVFISGKEKEVGEYITVAEDVAQMYVWIPRYTYTIFNGNNGDIPNQSIAIQFEEGINSDDTVICVDAVSGNGTISETCTDSTNGSVIDNISTYTHPAFTLGDTELKGIWVGKFENSAPNSTGDTEQVVFIKPNVSSWTGAIISNFYTSIKNISTNYLINADSHMMKNMEWGAVAYLSHSAYGLNNEVWINNSSTFITGCAGSSESASTFSGCQNVYDTVTGQNASTTGNIYGIYDMSGGAYEFVMGNMVDNTGNFYTSFSGFTVNPESQYYEAYTYDNSSNVSHSRGKLGDATKETLADFGNISGGWHSDYARFPYSNAPWFIRGGYKGSNSSAGLFNFCSCSYAIGYGASRSVLVSTSN